MLTRRTFAASLAAAHSSTRAEQSRERPNILWLTCEDIGPHLRAYGDTYSVSPHLDALARRGMLYRNVWSNAPVCAPARTAIISGLYPTCTGAEHMRSMTKLPAGLKMFPCYLREAGYYTTNNVKEDYNLEHTGTVWDQSSQKAHWRNRKGDQPFFSVFNFTITHESQLRTRPHKFVHDPGEARIPAYHPDTPEVRQDWAQYYDNITVMDGQARQVLNELKQDGLEEDTIVFFFGDHGSGMPRNKRCPYNSGLQVPLIVYVPEKWRRHTGSDYAPGGESKRLVGFVDLAPTVLSLAEVKPPVHLQGQAFLGPHTGPEPQYLHGFRGRMDERHDLIRSTRDQRYVYVRNYMPHRSHGEHLAYMFETPTTRVWKKLYEEGKLTPEQAQFWKPKPSEELFDLTTDRDEVRNLAASPAHQKILSRLRDAHREFELAVRDVDLLPEDELHKRRGSDTPYELGQDDQRYPLRRILAAAEAASTSTAPDAAVTVRRGLTDADSAVRYWAATGCVIRGEKAVRENQALLRDCLGDSSASVQVAAGEALARYGDTESRELALEKLIDLASVRKHGYYAAVQALNAIDSVGVPAPYRDRIAQLPRKDASVHERMEDHIPRLIDHILDGFSKKT